ncbi:hypothetical protein [Streptomyces spiralis]|uniref:hypothetical protein n=1 Tax=Streptomyces spiralis TaxID=66376 RepID=UPI0036A8CAF1
MHAFLLVAGVLAVAVPGLAWQIRRALRASRSLPATETQTSVVRPAPDTEPGIDLALRDECELLWSMPAFSSGHARMRDHLRNRRTEGEQA